MITPSNRGWLGTGFAILMFLILSIMISSMGRKIILSSSRAMDAAREKQAYWNSRVGRSVGYQEQDKGQGIIEFEGGTVLFDDLCVIGQSAEVVSGGSVITIESDDFDQGETIDSAHRLVSECNGQNRSPQLNWSGVPEDAESLVIIASDADAGNVTHWAIYGIAVSTTALAQNITISSPATELVEYAGPSPPQGDGVNHRYVFKIYALNATIDTSIDDGDVAALRSAMSGKVIACGQITGRYQRS